MKNIIIVAIIMMTSIACKQNVSAPVPVTVEVKDEPHRSQKWEYKEAIDEMTGKKTGFASVMSLNKIALDFPYDSTRCSIFINRGNDNLNLIFVVNEGQVSSIENDKIRLKFDENETISERFLDLKGKGGIIKWTKEIHQSMENSDTLMLEVPFYTDGRKIFKFDISGFDETKI